MWLEIEREDDVNCSFLIYTEMPCVAGLCVSFVIRNILLLYDIESKSDFSTRSRSDLYLTRALL